MDVLSRALPTADDVERLRPLLPVGYRHVAEAYRAAAAELDVAALDGHYREGLRAFEERLVPRVVEVLRELSGGAWDLGGYRAFAAGSDVDLMTHVVNAVSAERDVALYPGDWWGFRVGSPHDARIRWDASGDAALACLCVPSVRNGHLTDDMLAFLSRAEACLLNLNLYPTLPADERAAVATRLRPLLDRSVLSISFSRGFGMTASQLGVALVHPEHPILTRHESVWRWLTYFHNALAARVFERVRPAALASVDEARRSWVREWLAARGLPIVETGTYYVKSFRPEGELPERLAPLRRGDVVRLCFEPPFA